MSNKWFCLGIDTSNYTTSAAIVDEERNIIADSRVVLEVKQGERGLRQSQALFEHIGNLPGVLEELFLQAERAEGFARERICAVAVSERPRPVEGSYMPVFQAGISHGKAIARSLDVPCYGFSHQEGHLAAVLPGTGIDPSGPFLALHLSGGTTEVLLCSRIEGSDGPAFDIQIVGGTKDLSYGQVIDRTGVALGMSFPCGRAIDNAAMRYTFGRKEEPLPELCRILTEDGRINLSGIETQIQRYIKEKTASGEKGETLAGPLAAALLDRIGDSLEKMIGQCRRKTGVEPVLIAGGVASSQFLRERLNTDPKLFFGKPELSSDNAVGTAILGIERAFRE